MPIGKVVQGVPGDTVVVTRTGTWINHTFMLGSRPLDWDREHRPLPRLPETHYVLGAHMLWLDTNYPASFGSRYIGPVSDAAVTTVLTPLWIESRPTTIAQPGVTQ
jgi:type IV secretory pathway protease TraF